MKLVMDERIKHRLTGLVVIVSLAVIFLPVVMKSSNHRLDENIRVSLKLPHKPALPNVSIPKQEVMFGELNVAHVDLPTIPATPSVEKVAKAKTLVDVSVKEPVAVAKAEPEVIQTPKETVVAKNISIQHEVKNVAIKPNKPPTVVAANKIKSQAYAVQLAAFTKQENANTLVANLRRHGFSASSQKVAGRRGVYYQVLVGNLPQKNAAINLQKQLASSLRLHGFVVQTAVG